MNAAADAAAAGDVEAPAPAAAATSAGGSAIKWLRGLKERMLATVVGCVHGVAGALMSFSIHHTQGAALFPSFHAPRPSFLTNPFHFPVLSHTHMKQAPAASWACCPPWSYTRGAPP